MNLQCFGCHPGLLEMGIPCDQQPINEEYSSEQIEQRSDLTRDCFCDYSCKLFGDCCDDHDECDFSDSTDPDVSMFYQ